MSVHVGQYYACIHYVFPSPFVKSVSYVLKLQRLPLLAFALAGLAHIGSFLLVATDGFDLDFREAAQ